MKGVGEEKGKKKEGSRGEKGGRVASRLLGVDAPGCIELQTYNNFH